VSFVCSRISEQPTAFIFWVTNLVQVNAEVKTSDKHLLYWKVWGNLANHSYSRCKCGRGLSQAMGVENSKNRLFRASTNGIMWKQHEIWDVNGGIKYTYCMWVLVLRDSSAAPGQWDYFVLENTLQHKFLATVLHNQQILIHCITSASTWTNSVSMQMEQHVLQKHWNQAHKMNIIRLFIFTNASKALCIPKKSVTWYYFYMRWAASHTKIVLTFLNMRRTKCFRQWTVVA